MNTTTLSGEQNKSTGNDELDELLGEVRERSGVNWQIEVWNEIIGYKFALFKFKPIYRKQYFLYKEVGGVLPFQQVTIASGDIKNCMSFLCGYISGFDHHEFLN